MATSTKRPQTISQTTGKYATGKYYRAWYNLNNLKVYDKWADCGKSGVLIGGKNGTYPRPAPLKLTNFKFNIPSTAKISKITVYYRHYKSKVSGAYGSFNAPTLDLLNVSASAKKGSAVPTSSTEYSVSWSMSPSASKVNSSSFGVSINYPANSNTNPDIIHLRNVRVVVTYTNAVTKTSTSSSSNNRGTYISEEQLANANGRIIVAGSDGSISYVKNDAAAVSKFTPNTGNNYGIGQTGASVSKSKVYFGETVDITISVSSSSKITAAVPVYIDIPNGVNFVGKKSGNGSITEGITNDSQSGENYYWIANFSNSTLCSIVFTVKMDSLGVQTLTFRENTTNRTNTVKITSVLPPAIPFWGDLNSIVTTEENVELIITYYAQASLEKTFNVTFPPDVTVNWDDTDFTVSTSSNVHTVSKRLEANDNYFKCTLSFPDVGKYIINLEDDANNTLTRTIRVKPSYLALPYFVKIEADDYVLDRMGNSKEYVLSSMMKIVVNQNDADLIEAYDYNYRIGVFNTNLPEGSDDEYLFENAEWSSPVPSANSWEDIQVKFFYSDQYPLIFLITGEYVGANAEEIKIQYTYPTLMEEDYRQFAENPGTFEYPVKSIPLDTDSSSIDLQPGQVTNIAKLYDIDLSNFLESDEDNIIIEGVTVYFDVTSCDNPISIMSSLSSPGFAKVGNRSLNIESVFLDENNLSEEGVFSGMVALGGEFDLWGLDYDDFKLSSLEGLEIDIQLLNNFIQAVHFEFNNLRIVFHYLELEDAKIISKVNGVDLRYFNVWIKDVVIKPGTNNDVKYLDVEGTDANLAYRSNIREKEIEMEVRIPGCDIEETTAFAERLAKALSNKRDKFNKPILNEIEFSHHPNKIFPFILEDELDLTAEYTEYEGKIKLVVPSGTAYSKSLTITNATGTNSGIAKVNPSLRIIAQGTNIVVKETISNQQWRLTDSTLQVGDIIRIDCAERKAYKIQGSDDDIYSEDLDDTPDIDITEKVDFNSDWFLIQDDYNFECDNTAIIQSVSFNERW